jgi:iron complex transport system substrate-binding protein
LASRHRASVSVAASRSISEPTIAAQTNGTKGTHVKGTQLSGLLLAMAATALGFYVLWQAASFPSTSMPQGTRVVGDGFPKVLIDQTGRRVVLPRKPARIVSVTLATDEILLALVEPSRLAGVTYLADDARLSNMTQEAAAIPHKVRADPEQIISLQPDLVFVASFLRGEFIRLLQAAGLVLFQFQEYDSIAEIQQNIRLIGQVVGEEERAEALVAAMQARLHALAQRLGPIGERPRVLYWGSHGYTAGRLTSVHDLITFAGGENLAATYGIIGPANLSAEQVLAMNPQVIISGSLDQGAQGGLPPALTHQALQGTDAVRHGRVYTIPSRYLVTISQFIVDGVEEFARVLHGTALGPGGQL